MARRAHACRAGQERGKDELGAITKPGNRSIRRRRVLGGAIAASNCGGATALVRGAGKRKGALRDWLAARRARKPARRVTVCKSLDLIHRFRKLRPLDSRSAANQSMIVA
jgi:hypothetical protein